MNMDHYVFHIPPFACTKHLLFKQRTHCSCASSNITSSPLHNGAEKVKRRCELEEGVAGLNSRRRDGHVLTGASHTVRERNHAHVNVMVAVHLLVAVNRSRAGSILHSATVSGSVSTTATYARMYELGQPRNELNP